MSTTWRIDPDLESSQVTDNEIVRIGLLYPTGGHRPYLKAGMISRAKVRIIEKYETSSSAKQRRFMASTPAFR